MMTYTNHDFLVTAVNAPEDYNFNDIISVLPEKQDYRLGQWRRTKLTPCPILFHCTNCNKYLPVTEFYVYKKDKRSRKDILGQSRTSHCRVCANERFLKYDIRAKLLYAARNRARMKNLECDLTVDDIVIPEYCPVLGIKLEATIGKGRRNLNELDHSPSLDRMDNSKGYTKDNIMVISFRANNIKKDANLQELKAVVRYVEVFGTSATTNHGRIMR